MSDFFKLHHQNKLPYLKNPKNIHREFACFSIILLKLLLSPTSSGSLFCCQKFYMRIFCLPHFVVVQKGCFLFVFLRTKTFLRVALGFKLMLLGFWPKTKWKKAKLRKINTQQNTFRKWEKRGIYMCIHIFRLQIKIKQR